MKDIPVFTTQYGVASLALKEVPYRKIAYVRIQAAQQETLPLLLEECVGFCRAVGAERVFATGHGGLSEHTLYCAVVQMRLSLEEKAAPPANLFPVTEETVGKWREYYNRRMADVDNAAILTAADEKEILESRGAYFVHREGKFLGIGWLDGEKLLAVASLMPGAGETVMKTLLSAIPGEQAVLEVASTNEKAIKLYERLGFLKTGEVARWYKIF